MKKEFKETNLNLKRTPSFKRKIGADKNAPLRKGIRLLMNLYLRIEIKKIIVIETKSNFYLSQSLEFKLKGMLNKIKEQNPNLSELYDEALKTQSIEKANEYHDGVIELYKKIILWAKNNNPWWLEEISRLISIGIVNNFMKYYSKSRGDRPLNLSRKNHENETNRIKEEKNVGAIFRKEK